MEFRCGLLQCAVLSLIWMCSEDHGAPLGTAAFSLTDIETALDS